MTTTQYLDDLNELLKLASLGHFAEERHPKTKYATTIECVIFGKTGAW